MSDEEKMREPQDVEQAEADAPSKALTRRQFLIGAGAGIVVGAAGAAVVVGNATPAAKPSDTTAQTTGGQTGTQAQAVSDLPASRRRVALNIDGREHNVVIDVRMSLWEVLTYELGQASSNVGCDRAQCGACAVVVDGRAVNSCTVLAARLGRGQKILTVDGISKGQSPEQLHPVAKAYMQEGGFQCGICTRGFIMSTYALLNRNANPTDDDIREALGGNICRCAEYPKIYESVHRAAENMKKA